MEEGSKRAMMLVHDPPLFWLGLRYVLLLKPGAFLMWLMYGMGRDCLFERGFVNSIYDLKMGGISCIIVGAVQNGVFIR